MKAKENSTFMKEHVSFYKQLGAKLTNLEIQTLKMLTKIIRISLS